VQRVLSAQPQTSEQQQHHNFFQTFFVIKNRRARVIIDGGSCNNLVSSDLVKKLSILPCSYQVLCLQRRKCRDNNSHSIDPGVPLAPPPCQRRCLAHLRLLQRPRDLRLPLRPQVNLFCRYPPRKQIWLDMNGES
jgi:hypothetical protein